VTTETTKLEILNFNLIYVHVN